MIESNCNDKNRFLYPRSCYHGQVTPENSVRSNASALLIVVALQRYYNQPIKINDMNY